VWVEKDWQGGWSAFGGGGCVFGAIRTPDFCLAGAVLTYQLMPKLQIGAELFHRTADFQGNPGSSSVGVGWRYDLSKNFHLLGYIRQGVENAEQTDRYFWYASVLSFGETALDHFLQCASMNIWCLVGCVRRGLPSANSGDARFKSLSMLP
jgi:hypothetical protein